VNAALQVKTGVLVIDNGDALWDAVQLAYVETDERKAALRYVPANNYMRSILKRLQESGLWTVMTCPAKDEWENKTTTGRILPAGWKAIDSYMIGDIHLFLDTKQPGSMPVPLPFGEYAYRGQLRYSKNRSIVEGKILDNPTLKKVLVTMKEISDQPS